MYYDGYGYNFYSGDYGYYEFSPNNTRITLSTFVHIIVWGLIFIVTSFFFTRAYIKTNLSGDFHEDDDLRPGSEFQVEEYLDEADKQAQMLEPGFVMVPTLQFN